MKEENKVFGNIKLCSILIALQFIAVHCCLSHFSLTDVSVFDVYEMCYKPELIRRVNINNSKFQIFILLVETYVHL